MKIDWAWKLECKVEGHIIDEWNHDWEEIVDVESCGEYNLVIDKNFSRTGFKVPKDIEEGLVIEKDSEFTGKLKVWLRNKVVK